MLSHSETLEPETCAFQESKLWRILEYAVSMVVPNTKPIATVSPPATHMPTSCIGKALGLKSMAPSTLMQAVESGLRWSAVHKFLDTTGLSQQDLVKYFAIPERTFVRRRVAGRFNRRESEQLLRLAEIYQAALNLFDGDTAATRTWLTCPAHGLGNARPIDFAQSEFGAREVHDLIGRLGEGVFSRSRLGR
jgi:putative toxin-antitoxin system antitoxin component (TIGR02293 family)